MQAHKKTVRWAIGLSYLTVLGMTVDLRISSGDETPILRLLKAAGGFSVERLFLFAGLCALYAYAFRRIQGTKWARRDKVWVAVPAVLFAAFMVVGYSFARTDSLDLVLKGKVQMVKSLMAFVGYGIGFAVAIAWFYTWLTGQSLLAKKGRPGKQGWLGRYKAMLAKAPFRTAFLTLIILYLPYAVLSYPAIFMGDTREIILQGFNLPDATSNYLNLIDESVTLNGHHPIVYALFVHGCLVVGKGVFGSYNVGIFLAALSQLLGMCAISALAVRVLARLGVYENILLGLVAYVAFAPRMQNYMFLMTKDVLAGGMLLLFLLSLFRMVRGETAWKRAAAELSVFGIALGLLRNDGKYIILGSVVLMLFFLKGHRKTLLVSGGVTALCLGLFFGALMPALHITPASRREALSVPFQQTARYLRDHGREVTEEEWDAVAAVLDAQSLGKAYVPTKSDRVKETFHEEATGQEMAAYFKAWFQMGLKHPGTYVQATMNNYYNYFYPGSKLASAYTYSWSQKCVESLNSREGMGEAGRSFNLPKTWDTARETYETFRERLFELPVLSLLKCPAAYVWLLMLLVCYLLKEGAWQPLALTVPLALSVGICLLGPCNGNYFRYLYGTSLCLPFVFFLSLYLHQHPGGKER